MIVWDPPPALEQEAAEVARKVWPGSSGHDPLLSPRLGVRLHDGKVVAALHLLSKQIEHRGEVFLARGLSGVVSDPDVRGHGYARELVTAALEVVRGSAADLGLFTCDHDLAGFYVRAGWSVLPGSWLVGGTPDDPFPSDVLGKTTLGDLVSERARAADWTGPIALFPGTVDRLW